ncbi:MAG: hypothetical protein ACOC53_05405 [Candidatus Saliniplasma sp.]
MIGYLILPLIFAFIFAGVYSWYFGISKIKDAVIGAIGLTSGAFVDSVLEVGVVLQAGIANFGDMNYIGMSMLAIVLIFFTGILSWNVASTINKDPQLIR